MYFAKQRNHYSAYIINIPHRTTRLGSIRAQLISYNIPYKIFSAITPKDIQDEKRLREKGLFSKKFDPETKMSFNINYKIRLTEIGCLQSHIQILFKIIQKNSTKPFLILEDDAQLLPNFYKQSISIMNSIKSRWDLLHLGYCPRKINLCDLNGKRGDNFCK